MIKRTQQDWSVGSMVKVGFLTLEVKAAIATPGDFKPDAYILINNAATQLYKFVPHNGIEKISPLEARELIADSWVHADRVAAQAIEHAKQSAKAISDINEIIFK
ncbi:hypothetical protein SAMN05443245_5236 [Paraburkholderia fungorum]|uniref:Uncharacterized protein n=1 Tax=Paraburkholderia fungorum TaxID=134537 RepID=A0A1H1IIE5_9BURK|nr:hypothetical protein [Paraburkholderia fungorum]SDR37535.1 hypothetical protein SAMN05443245_5236 [Paraburkholderia fungorum]